MATEDNGTILASSLSSDVLRSALDSVMDNAFGFPLVRASPRSLIEELLQLPSGTPSHVLLSKGEYGSCCIKNTAPCIITAEAGPFNDTKSEVGWDAESQCGLKDLSALSVFNDLVAIEAHGPIAFKGIWFSNPVHITGVGPVFFSQCLFGAAVKVVPDDAAPTALFAHIHISINDVCTFTECQFNHKCVAATVENSNEAPVLTATGDTKLNVHHCGFFGPGVTSPAIMLCERAKLEADNLVISRWSGNSLVVGDHSRAFVWNSHFSLNGGGVWVKGHGKLEIRATHLKTVRGRGSNLVLTDKGCCTAYECIISSPVSKRLTRGKSLVLARDKTYLSLFTCELAWLARDPSSDVVDVASLKEFVSSCQSDRVDEFGLFLVMLMENSKGTLSQCSLRLPLLWSHDEWRVAVGVLLKSVPQADAIPLYAVQNAIFFSFAVNDDAAPGEAGSNSTSDLYTLGLVLPADSDSSDVRGIEALGAMWMETNRFIRVDGSPMVDLSQLFVTYEMYCGFTNQILKTYSSEGIDDFPFFHNPPTMRKETLLYKQPSASDSCSSTSVLAAEGAGDIEESFSDFDHRSNRNWTPKREDTGVFLDSLLGRSTLATPRSTKSHPSFSGTTNAILLGTQRLNLKSSVNVTIRLYDAFFRKCNMTQHFSDLLNELRDGQRQRERLTRDEMEKQAQRLHTQGLQSSFISSRVQVAGAARNYVLQKRNEQKHQPGGEASPETSLVRPDEEVKHIGNGEAEVRPTQPVKRMPDATNCNGDICDRTPSTSSKSHTPPSMVATTNKKTYRKKRKHVQEK
uniref:Uncharacterized protein n=1 Tax=Trypanosoma vivax (strain Y486) TaxID=1055687 RepID=G0U447_TRYVY|nr:conserved hypothetical protein [Trypanosoma vivax Y486]